MSTKYITAADTAKEVRKALKLVFPGQKFSVRTSTYSGGASIQVNYDDGPAESAVKTVAGQFAGATFDGMIDLKEYRESEYNGEKVHWGADYVFVNRSFSPEVEAQAEEFTNLAIAADGGTPTSRWWGEVPQAFWRVAKDGEHLGGETNWWALRTVAAAWLVEGRTMVVRATTNK